MCVIVATRALCKKRHLIQKTLQRRRILDRGKGLPFFAFGHTHIALPFRHLTLVHQAAVIVLVARDWRAPALDRIGQKTDRAVMVDGGKGLCHRAHTVAAKVFHQRRQLCIRAPVDQCADLSLIAKVLHQAVTPNRPAHEGQRRIGLIGAIIDPLAQLVAARLFKGRALQGAIFYLHHIPAKGVKDLLDPLKQPFPHDPVKGLAVVVA